MSRLTGVFKSTLAIITTTWFVSLGQVPELGDRGTKRQPEPVGIRSPAHCESRAEDGIELYVGVRILAVHMAEEASGGIIECLLCGQHHQNGHRNSTDAGY